MADIFISYASGDRPLALRLADALEARGWSVWWDHSNLRGGDPYGPVIKKAIREATVVVVVWSEISVESPWVHDEAKLALREQKLVPLRIDMIDPPMGFGGIHTIDLASWTGETDAKPFERLVKDLGHYLGPPPLPLPTKATPPKPPASTGDAAVAQAAYDRGDYPTALSLARPAAERGDRIAQCILGFLYQNGWGVPWNSVEAARWYQKAANQGNADAQYNLGLLYQNGRGVARDSAEAARWFRMAADQGHAKAQTDLGMLYQNGRGVARDYAEAARWFRMAADQGNADAQSNLGMLHQNGRGVARDYAEAARWYRKAADQGNADAQSNLGWLHQNGWGVARDYAEAARWYRKAADQGEALAQYNLGWLYYNGQGVAQDKAQARLWMQKAAAAGNEDAKKWLKEN